MTIGWHFDNTYSKLPDTFKEDIKPTPVHDPELVILNDKLSKDLNLDFSKIDKGELSKIFSGNSLPKGSTTIAQAYAGHQFGQFNPDLGDGRAHLLAEVISTKGERYDIALKGSGRTPYSRGGDGRAWLGPVLREYIVSEAMYNLGIPTTRALAIVSSGEPVYREAKMPGAIITRIAKSHIRIGTFQWFSATSDISNLQTLLDYSIKRHYPDAKSTADFLRAVCLSQAELVAEWMRVGFIHGVMNTDNCLISGETIDYGPCAFMDEYSPSKVFSSIDNFGRYSVINQSKIIIWNLAQLASALLLLHQDETNTLEEFQEIINETSEYMSQQNDIKFASKLGIDTPVQKDKHLISELMTILDEEKADFTNFFSTITNNDQPFEFMKNSAYLTWEKKWHNRIQNIPSAKETMRQANPAIIPRNHNIEKAIQSALSDDFEPFHTLNEALINPYNYKEKSDLLKAPKEDEKVTATFCGT